MGACVCVCDVVCLRVFSLHVLVWCVLLFFCVLFCGLCLLCVLLWLNVFFSCVMLCGRCILCDVRFCVLCAVVD